MKVKGFNLKQVGSNIRDTEVNGVREVVSDIHFVLQTDEQKFIFFYEKFLSVIADVGYTDIRVFFELCFHTKIGKNTFVSNNKLISDIAKKIGVSPNTVRNSLTALNKAELLHRDKEFKRNYYVNSNYAWYGGKEDMPKVASIIIEQTAFMGENTSVVVKGNKMTVTTKLSEYWFDVKDKLPANGSNVIVRPHNFYMVYDNGFINVETGELDNTVTHWCQIHLSNGKD